MATMMYFEETIRDQGDKASFEVELGRSSFYPEDSIYLIVDGKTVIDGSRNCKKIRGRCRLSWPLPWIRGLTNL